MWLSGLFQLQPFFSYFLLLLERRTKLMKLWAKFQIKLFKFLQSRCSILLFCKKLVRSNWLSFFKNFKKQCVLQCSNATYMFVSRLFFSYSHILPLSCCIQNIGLSKLNSGLTFRSNQSNFCHLDIPACCKTSAAKLAAFFQKSQKIVSILSVNETKVTCKNAFTDNCFALESNKKSRNDKNTLL